MKSRNDLSGISRRHLRALSVLAGVGCAVLAAGCGNSGSSPVNWGDDGGGGGSSSGGGSSGSSNASSSGSGSGNTSGSGSGGGNSSGGTTSSSGASSGASSGGGSSSGGTSADGGSSGSSSGVLGGDGGTCALSASNVRVTEIDTGVKYTYTEADTPMELLALSPIPSGGSRLAYMGPDSMVHIVQLDATDNIVMGSAFGLPAYDFQDVYADDTGGTVLVTRDAMGGGTNNCGNPSNLCSLTNPTGYSCWDMYLVRFNGSTEAWATKLTTSSASLPPYSTSPTGAESLMIWWYAHNGRIAFNGTNYAAYYGVAISVTQSGCINIHQGDEERIVSSTGTMVSGGFDVGCSHSSFERITWDGSKFVQACNKDGPTGGKSGRIAFAPNENSVILPVDEFNTELGAIIPAGGGGYWVVATDLRAGQTAGAAGLDDVHLLHTTTGMADKNITLVSDSGLNDRNPHLAPFGANRMLAAWETSTVQAPNGGHLAQNDTSRKLYVQALDSTTGAALGAAYNIPGVVGSRYQDFRIYPDNSVAYAAPGSTATKVKIIRVSPCP